MKFGSYSFQSFVLCLPSSTFPQSSPMYLPLLSYTDHFLLLEAMSYLSVQSSLKLVSLLTKFQGSWDYRHAIPYLAAFLSHIYCPLSLQYLSSLVVQFIYISCVIKDLG